MNPRLILFLLLLWPGLLSAQTFSRTPAFRAAAARTASASSVPGNAFTYIAGGTNDGVSHTVNYTATVGRLVVVFVKWEGTGGVTSITNNAGTPETLTLLTQTDHNNNDLHTRIGWLVTAQSGATSFTATHTGSPTFERMRVLEFSKAGGTVSVDASVLPTAPTTTGTSFTVGPISTSADNSLVICTYSEYTSGLPTSPQIGGSAATMFPADTSHGSSQMWYRILTSTIDGASGTATVPNAAWIGQLVAFKSL